MRTSLLVTPTATSPITSSVTTHSTHSAARGRHRTRSGSTSRNGATTRTPMASPVHHTAHVVR